MANKDVERVVDNLRLMDDDLMSKVFDEEDNKCIQLTLSVILEDKGLKVIDSQTQKERKAISGHSVKFDVHAISSKGEEFDVEIQRSDKGADRKRARYNSALLDSGMLPKGDDYSKLNPSYVIFITENDILKAGKPLYHIDRTIKELDNVDFNDDSHIIYVNGQYEGSDEIGKLMHDFRCKYAADLNFDILSKRVKHFKEEGGRDSMCKAVEDYGKMVAEKEKENTNKETISALLNKGMTPEWIHDTLEFPMELIIQIQNSLKISK